jgi:hypothetical protein
MTRSGQDLPDQAWSNVCKDYHSKAYSVNNEKEGRGWEAPAQARLLLSFLGYHAFSVRIKQVGALLPLRSGLVSYPEE